jgi:lysozyme family protein
MLLQTALGIETDGRLGPATLAVVQAADPGEVIRRLMRERLAFLSHLPTWPVFGRGWRRRVLSVEREALRLVALPQLSGERSDMIDTKTLFASRTVWANLIGLAALILGMDTGAFQEALVQFIAAASFIASTVFRILATKQLAA